MSLIAEWWLAAGALPVAATAAMLLLLRTRGERAESTLAPVAGALGFAAGWMLLDWAPFVPEQTWHWLMPLAIAAAVVESLGSWLRRDARRRSGIWLLWASRIAVSLTAGWLLVPDWEEMVSSRPYWIATVAAGTSLLWFTFAAGWAAPTRRCWAIVPVAVVLASSLVLFQSGSAKFAELAWMLAAVTAASAVCLRDPGRIAAAMAPALAVLLPGLLLSGYFYTFSDVPPVSFLLPLVVATLWTMLARGALRASAGIGWKFARPIVLVPLLLTVWK